jgi:hypothetical protein
MLRQLQLFISVLIFASLSFVACNSVYTPKPNGYFKIDFPEKKYQLFDQPGYPYAFEYPVYAKVVKDSTFFGEATENEWWINVDFPQFNGRIYVSYKEIGKYSENEPDSLWRSYYLPSKNKRFEGSFLTGVPIGIHTFYHYNGQKMNSGNYSAGMKDGDWKYYDEEGFNYLTIEYKNDIEIKWQGKKIKPTYEESLRTYNITIDGNKTQTIKRK